MIVNKKSLKFVNSNTENQRIFFSFLKIITGLTYEHLTTMLQYYGKSFSSIFLSRRFAIKAIKNVAEVMVAIQILSFSILI